MKTLVILVGLMMCFTPAFTQKSKSKKVKATEIKETKDEAAFRVAADLAEGAQPAGALQAFKQFMILYPHSKLRASAHYNIAYLYFTLYQYDSAKLTFRQILDQPYNEKDPNDIMEPYMLYKHNTCRMLTHIALEEEDYQAAADYIKMFDEKFPYQHFCGNEWSAYHMYKAVMLAKVYKGMKKPELAMQTLLPYAFDDGLASNEQVVEELIDLIKHTHSSDQIKTELDRAINTITIHTDKSYDRAYIKLFGADVPIHGWLEDEDEKKEGLERYKAIVLQSNFFQRFL